MYAFMAILFSWQEHSHFVTNHSKATPLKTNNISTVSIE